jgi:ribosomal protein S18 acetylase RimI-like enzyme
LSTWRIEQLEKRHDRSSFDCGAEVLNEYLAKRARSEQRRRFCTCFLAIHNETDQVGGFYTLSASSIALPDLPPTVQKKLPRYPNVPVARIGRLAVDRRYQGQRLGGALIGDALQRVLNSDIASYAIIVDAKDEQAVSFYRHLGFESLRDKPDVLYLPIATASDAFS